MNDIKKQLAPGWSTVNIVLILVLYLITWPLSLLMIAYIIWGQKAGLDLSNPETLTVFGRRLVKAWRAAVDSFSK